MGSQRIGHDLSHTHHIQSRFLPLVSYVLRRHGEKKIQSYGAYVRVRSTCWAVGGLSKCEDFSPLMTSTKGKTFTNFHACAAIATGFG